MEIWRGIQATPTGWGRSVVTVGVFDGVHRGHAQLIGSAAKQARERGLKSVVVTFDPHPAQVVRPGSAPMRLSTLSRRCQLLAELGVDGVCVLPFTKEMSRQSPEEFVHTVLVERLHAAQVMVGENFRFGYKAAGNLDLLRNLGQQWGFSVVAATLEGNDEATFSSTYIRTCIAAGAVSAAAEALGREYDIEGIVVRGAGRGGSQLGFPTANLSYESDVAVVADGIYAGWLTRADGSRHAAAISVGTNPTFAGEKRTLEAYVLDFDEDLYGEQVSISFTERLRQMLKFDNVDELIWQIETDVAQTREVLKRQ
ncbi:bifunctional riboflavin kinase/FAD synthetase [Natronoglycomyces albus]|uniref:Riboflavin biosynthesis protein n=1 Tax=Natronoglycomyces albus TaxID=2811108 RepID=A0A895XER1_9ACTN|nr:bifunctional riboflavin kinase/FAD synthetase [Natronoglycomyces albus]QSB04321.1 bifunctional riboflavin kinase/FAD synthetase [Natronoglycomyces albus]